jgi:phosphohistidine phosphatase
VTVRHVYLLRHAKSSWQDPGRDDHDRPLNARGRRSAAEVARTLQQERIRPDVALVSSAERTVETANALDLASKVSVEPNLYLASARTLLDRLRTLSEDVRSVLVVGHNPGIEELVATLRRADGGPPERMTTATLVALEVELDRWSLLDEHSAQLVGRWLHKGAR